MDNSRYINRLISAYEESVCGTLIDRYSMLGIIEYGIRTGWLKIEEKKSAYTFGGVTIALTDTELATVMHEVAQGKKIHAIKLLRNDVSDAHTLKDAKDFCDHLGEIILKANSIAT